MSVEPELVDTFSVFDEENKTHLIDKFKNYYTANDDKNKPIQAYSIFTFFIRKGCEIVENDDGSFELPGNPSVKLIRAD